eukprot:TRINITY_DN7890_c0_g1_i2.p1 TRINITY_DN7890_c0_g1~~TRINITY_DN7890_c0_g1_i2.p1  ORF type:complete len:829 (+),score=169.72 TRINITY_DN7890_c0_g1_i2:397-2883(+)
MADRVAVSEDSYVQSSPQDTDSSRPVVPSVGEAVIPMVNKLQDIFARLGSASTIDLPQIAVVGSQSSGKSSVLEALVGRDFLPRGPNICTRRPLVLQLVHVSGPSEWGEFLHVNGKRFYDFGAIRAEIEAETEREVGKNKGVSDKQIRLKICSPKVLNMTLVDLPGITKVPVGDQPSDIEARIRTMIMSYIKHETCIILAVSPANSDLSNSDALQIARLADPDGHRTIGVITKLDIMDRGTDARNFLLGKEIPLRLGYVGVVNRSQADIDSNKSIQDALAYEANFFSSRPVYHNLEDRCGIPHLAKKLNQILVKHIKAILPNLKARINAQMVNVSRELLTYGEVTDSKTGQGALLLNILTKYCEAFTSMIDGKNEEMSTTELSGGARIHYIFQSIFVKSLEEVDPCEDFSDEDIRMAIQNATGPRNALFVPEVPFEVLVRRQIARLLDPSLQCARFIYEELMKISRTCKLADIERFPVLGRRLDEVVGKFLREGLGPAELMIRHLIEMEMDYINTAHPAFLGGSKAVEIALQQQKSSRAANTMDGADLERIPGSEKNQKSRAILARSGASSIVSDSGVRHQEKTGGSWGISSIFSGSESRAPVKDVTANKGQHEATNLNNINGIEPMFSMIQLKEPPASLRPSEVVTENEAVEIQVTKLLLKSYYDIVRKNIQDLVPKTIMHFLVNHTKRELHGVFIRKLYRENIFEEILQEKGDIVDKRKRCSELLKVLQEASNTLDEMPYESAANSGISTSDIDSGSLPKAQGFSSSAYTMANGNLSGLGSHTVSGYLGSPKNAKPRRSSHSGEQPSSFSPLSNGSLGANYPTVHP